MQTADCEIIDSSILANDLFALSQLRPQTTFANERTKIDQNRFSGIAAMIDNNDQRAATRRENHLAG
jgi:hypothetical protein